MSDSADPDRERAFSLIGKLISAFSSTDAMVTALLGALMRMGDEGTQELVLHAVPLKQKIAIIRVVLRQLQQVDYLSQTERLLDRLDRIREKRDIAAHGILSVENGEFVLLRLSLPTVFRLAKDANQIIKVSTLGPLADELHSISDALSSLVETIEKRRSWNSSIRINEVS